jgi:hypothetical protein
MFCVIYITVYSGTIISTRNTSWHSVTQVRHRKRTWRSRAEFECDVPVAFPHSFLTVSTDRISNIHSEVLALVLPTSPRQVQSFYWERQRRRSVIWCWVINSLVPLLTCWLTCGTKPPSESRIGREEETLYQEIPMWYRNPQKQKIRHIKTPDRHDTYIYR